jgi:dihydrofolate reductase
MIRAIAAMDDRLGLATDTGIPWHVPADVEHFRSAVASSDVLMGYATYTEFEKPLPDGTNFVATRSGSTLRPGFVPVTDVDSFLAGGTASGSDAGVWIIGGAQLYARTLQTVDELHLTRVAGDFHCTKFFPAFAPAFRMVSDQPSPPVPDTPAIRFQTWTRSPRTEGGNDDPEGGQPVG